MSGILYLIPTTLGDNDPYQVLPADIKNIIHTIKHFVVEDVRTARRFLKKIDSDININDLTFEEINKRTRFDEINEFLNPAYNGENMGVMSEAGCPGVADPGADLVQVAHRRSITVKPLVGPSSILLSLMASGMNGQHFAFAGYIPVKQPDRNKAIKYLEHLAINKGQTQIFIETPYRNNQMIQDLAKALDTRTKVCVACDLTLETEYIRTLAAGQWKNEEVDLHKRPAIFLLGR